MESIHAYILKTLYNQKISETLAYNIIIYLNILKLLLDKLLLLFHKLTLIFLFYIIGTVTAVMWLEADKNPADNICTQVNTYVRVYGLLRNQNNQQHVLILRMHPLEDLNELTCHFMEVIYFILKAKKPAEEPTVPRTFDNTLSGMSAEQVTVLEIVRSANDAECGIEKRDILTKVPKNVIPRLDEILDFLLCEGHIYTTSSEDFFKAT